MMNRIDRWSRTVRLLVLPVLVAATSVAHADPTSRYDVSGSTGATLWALGQQLGTDAVAFVFEKATPEKGENPEPGPRLGFSVTQWQFGIDGWKRRQWYGDAALKPEMMKFGAEMKDATLDATIMGTLEERSATGATIFKEVPGRIQVGWVATGNPGNSTVSYVYQTPAYSTQVATIGSGRFATATASVLVEPLGAQINLWGFGNLSTIGKGTFSVTMP